MGNLDHPVDFTTRSRSAVSLAKRPVINCSRRENIVPAPHTQLAVDIGEGTTAVAGELQGDGFGRGDDCI